MKQDPHRHITDRYGRFIVRLFDILDGWVDVSGPLPWETALARWNEHTCDGTRNTEFLDHQGREKQAITSGDYYRIFPTDTRMIFTPEFLGR